MSYILEALKKSEKKRQGEQSNLAQLATQETGEQKSGPPRRPLWPLLLGLALVVNAGVMLLIFWPGDTPSSAPSDNMAVQTESSAEHTKTGVKQRNASGTAIQAPASEVKAPHRDGTNAPETPETVAVDSLASHSTKTQMSQPQAPKQGSASATDSATPQVSKNNDNVTDSPSMDQRQASTLPEGTTEAAGPATRDIPAAAERKTQPQPEVSATEDPPPRYSDLSSTLRTRLPELHMSVHAYSADPSGGLVRVNNKMLRPGAYLQEGIRLEAVTMDGAIFSYAGQEFLLPRR